MVVRILLIAFALSLAMARCSETLCAQDYVWVRAAGPDGGDCRSIAASPAGQRIVAGFVRGVHVSSDGGSSWQTTAGGNFVASGLAFDPVDGSTVYAAVSSSSDPLRKSIDSGSSWTTVRMNPFEPQPSLSCVAVKPDDSRTIYAGSMSAGVFRSTDGGANWAQINSGLGSANVRALAVHTQFPSRIICGTFSGVFVSLDAGDSWVNASSGLGSLDVRAVAVSPSDPLTVYAGCAAGVFRSTDGCSSWSSAGLTGVQINGLAVHPLDPNTVLAASPEGLYRSTDGGAGWSRIASGLREGEHFRVVSFVSTDGSRVMAGTGGTIYRSEDGGFSWTVSSSGIRGMRCQALAAAVSAPGTVILGCGTGVFGAGVWISRDWGMNWEFAGGAADYVYSVAAASDNADHIFAGCDLGILRTLNGGSTWDRTLVEGANRFVALCTDTTNPDRLFAGSNGNAVWRTVDRGSTWIKSSSGLDWPAVRSLAVNPAEPWRLYAGVDAISPRHGVYRTTDSADSWNPAESGVQGERIWSLAVDPVDGAVYAGSMSNGLFKSTDGGISFQRTGTGLGSPVICLAVDPRSRRVYAGSWGGVYLSSDLGQTFSRVPGCDELPLALLVDPTNPDFVYVGSDGNRVWRLSVRADVETPGEAKHRPDGQLVRLSQAVVAGVFDGRFYVQDERQSSGMAVVSDATVAEGDRVSVTGTLRTVDGEREIVAISVSKIL